MWPSRAITFIDNHDTGSTLNHWPFPNNHLQEGYAYILTHPGTPCVFYDHLYAEGGLRQVSTALELYVQLQGHCMQSSTVQVAAVYDAAEGAFFIHGEG
jgi:alpha-amylase